MQTVFKLKKIFTFHKTIFPVLLFAISLLLSLFFISSITIKETSKLYAADTQTYYVESLTESSWNTDLNYQDKVSLTFTPDANSSYLIVASWSARASVTGPYPSNTKLTRTTDTPRDFNVLSSYPSNNNTGGAIGVDTFGSAPNSQTYKIQFATTNTQYVTAYVSKARIIAVKLSSADQYTQVEARTTVKLTAFQDKATLTFTPASTGDYIILGYATMDGASTSYDYRIQMTIDGTAYSYSNLEPNNASNRYPWAIVTKINLTNTAHTLKIQYSSESASYNAGIANARIIAIRADRFTNSYFAETVARATTTLTTYQTMTTLTQTPNATAHLTLATAGVDTGAANGTCDIDFFKDTTSLSPMSWTLKDNTNRGAPFFYMNKETLANTSTSWYLKWKDSYFNSTQGIQDARILVLELTESAVTVGTTGTQTSSTVPNTSNLYIGGAFTLVRDAASANVTSIIISNTGSISDSNLSNLILYYKQETSCSASIPGDATQFNSTPGSFSSGSSTVAGSVAVGTSQICVYAQVNIAPSASNGDTIDLQITIPSSQVIASAGSVVPSSVIAISGTTTVSNSAPTFSSFSNNGPVNPGSTLTFNSIASDTDSVNVFLLVCKTQGITGIACDGGAGDTLCTSSLSTSNPSCTYTVPSVTPDTSYNSYPYIFDAGNAASASAAQGTLSTYTINNVVPVVSSVTINGGAAINLTESTTKAVTLTATITDNNSCYGSEISSVYGYTYRSGIAYTGCDTAGEANSNFCYPEITCTVVGGTCTDNTDASANYTCTANIQYYADPTDTGTLYPTENWLSSIKATDNNSGSGNFEVSSGVEMNSLIAFNITTAVNYGGLSVGQSNDPLDRTTTITPTGNTGLDEELSGPANMCVDYPTCSGAKIAVGNQKYSLAASTSFASASTLSTTPTEIELNVQKPINGSPSTKSIWWGMFIPTNTNPGTYSGAITVTGIKGETVNW